MTKTLMKENEKNTIGKIFHVFWIGRINIVKMSIGFFFLKKKIHKPLVLEEIAQIK